jgi:Protein of unknown function (DUF1778)
LARRLISSSASVFICNFICEYFWNGDERISVLRISSAGSLLTVHFQGEDRMPVNLKERRHPRKIARIEARLNPEQKRRIEYAARLKGASLSDFMVLSDDDAAAQAK